MKLSPCESKPWYNLHLAIIKRLKGWTMRAAEGVEVSINIKEKFPKSGRPSMIQGAINDFGCHRYFWNAESLGWFHLIWGVSITLAWSPSIISIYHTPVIPSYDWGTIFGCWLFAQEFEIFTGSERTECVLDAHERQLAKGYWSLARPDEVWFQFCETDCFQIRDGEECNTGGVIMMITAIMII